MVKSEDGFAVPSLRSVIVFLICTFALTWLAFLPLILEWVRPESTVGAVLLPLVGIGAPTITAFVLVAVGSGRGFCGCRAGSHTSPSPAYQRLSNSRR